MTPRSVVPLCLLFAAAALSPPKAAGQTAPPLPAAGTERSSDVIVVLDLSGSMNDGEVLDQVTGYLARELVRPILKVGDRFSLIGFGERATLLFDREIAAARDLDAVEAQLRGLVADQDYTDMGTALETLDAALESRKNDPRRQVALFVTDGKNAPPPASPYSGKDLSLDERFLATGKKISAKGWRLYVIGLGEDTDAPAVAAAVEGSSLAAPGAVEDGAGPDEAAVQGGAADSGANSPGVADPGLTAYLETTAADAAARSVSAAGPATVLGDAVAPERRGPSALLIAALVVVVLGLAAVAFFVLRSRKGDDEEPPKP